MSLPWLAWVATSEFDPPGLTSNNLIIVDSILIIVKTFSWRVFISKSCKYLSFLDVEAEDDDSEEEKPVEKKQRLKWYVMNM